LTSANLVQDIGQTSSTTSLLLALATIFTAEVERRRQQHRVLANADAEGFRTIGGLAVGLAGLTLGSVLSLASLVLKIVSTIGRHDPFQPALSIFVLAWILLLALFVWQVTIAFKAFARK
jgi:hypothetical protein